MRKRFILAVSLQFAVLIGILAYRAHWVATGQRVVLRTAPVDPRDIFRGEYLELSYEISTLVPGQLGTRERFLEGERVYVGLEPTEDGTYRASSLGKRPPAEGRFIQGRVGSALVSSRCEISLREDSGLLHRLRSSDCSGLKKGTRGSLCVSDEGAVLPYTRPDLSGKGDCRRGRELVGVIENVKVETDQTLNIDYGIESYFVEEGRGRAIESSRDARALKVEVSLRKDGKGIITGLWMEGRQIR